MTDTTASPAMITGCDGARLQGGHTSSACWETATHLIVGHSKAHEVTARLACEKHLANAIKTVLARSDGKAEVMQLS